MGSISITWGYRGLRIPDGENVVEGHNVTVCVDPDTFKKMEIPEWLRKGLTDYMDGFTE